MMRSGNRLTPRPETWTDSLAYRPLTISLHGRDMTRLLLAFAAVVAAAAPAAAAERRYSVTDFDRIEVEGPFIVRLTRAGHLGDRDRHARRRSTGSTVDVTGQTLRIRRNRANWGGNAGAQTVR